MLPFAAILALSAISVDAVLSRNGSDEGRGHLEKRRLKTTSTSIPSCPNFLMAGGDPGGKKSDDDDDYDGGKKESKSSKGGKKASFECGKKDKHSSAGDDGNNNIQCFGSNFVDTTITLQTDLFCNTTTIFEEEPLITMQGPNALLDCNGFSIIGVSVSPELKGIGVLLLDGASAINCDIRHLFRGVYTAGDGCTTIENVAVSFAGNDAIRINNTGNAILSDIFIENTGQDGISYYVPPSGDDDDNHQLFVLNGAMILRPAIDGIYWDGDASVVSEFFGRIVLEHMGRYAIREDSGKNEMTVFGSLTSKGGGVIIGGSTNVTFAQGSESSICFSPEKDLISLPTSSFTIEHGAYVQCERTLGTDAVCTEACVTIPDGVTIGEGEACVVDDD